MNGKRLLASLLTFLMLLSLLPAAALAEGETAPEAQPIPDETQDDSLTGYFLVGSMNGWTPSEVYRFTWESYDATTGVQWLLLCTLNAGDEFKAVQVENGSIVTWYPDGTNNNYVVDAAQAGEKAVYFRPDDTSTWGGHFRIGDPPTYHVSTKVNSTVHGSISVSPEDAHAGDPITVTVTPDEGYILSYIEAPSITKVNDSTYTFPMPGYATTVYATFKLAPGFYFDNTNRVVPDYYVPEEKFSPSSSPFGEWERETVLTEGNYLDVKAVYTPELATERLGYYWCFQTMKLTYSSSSSRPKVTEEQAGHAMVFLTETEREGYIKAIHLDRSYMDPGFVWDAWITIKNFHLITVAEAENGTVSAPADAYESQSVTLTVTPAEGYELDTLSVVDADGHEIPVENNSFTMPDMPVTVTATFKLSEVEQTVTVSFDAGEGTVEPATKEVNAGEAIGELPVPTREGGWVFVGWYTAPAETAFNAGQGTQVTAETVSEDDTTVYADWRLPGDVNGDGKVNNKDATRLQKYLKGDEVEVVEFNLDVNGDGKVNNKDLTRLQRYLKTGDMEIF